MAKKKKKKLNKRKLLVFLLFFYLIGYGIYYIFSAPISNIIIKGNTLINDYEIIEISNIKNYPSIFSLNVSKIKDKIKSMPLVKDVSIKRNLKFQLIIEIDEYKAVCLYSNTDKILLENSKDIDNNSLIKGIPTLINYTPEDVLKDFLMGLGELDYGTLSAINEIFYDPSINENNEIMDSTRFLLKMNDGNSVYINNKKLSSLKYYQKIYASLNDKTGVLHLDSGDYLEVK